MATKLFFPIVLIMIIVMPVCSQSLETVNGSAEPEELFLDDADTSEIISLMSVEEPGRLIATGGMFGGYGRILIGASVATNRNDEIEQSEAEVMLPHEFALRQNFPNPFNPSTLINYQLPVEQYVTLKVFNILGQEVATLVDEMQGAGYKSVSFNASSLSSGVYMYRIKAGTFEETKKLLLMK